MATKNLITGTINQLQGYIAIKIKQRGFDDETLHERLLLLVEEVGELVRSCRKLAGMNVDPKRTIKSEAGEEITDIINMVFAVAIKLNLDVEAEFLKKEKVVDKRFYKRSKPVLTDK